MRIVVHVTGTLNSCFVPVALNWLKATRTDVVVRAVLSESATTFVSPKAISALLGTAASLDRWDDPVLTASSASPHTWLAGHDALLVFPASLNTLGRIHRLDSSTPFLSAVHCTNAPVIVAPNLPPGAEANPAVETMLHDLRIRRGITVVDPVARPSASVDRSALVAPPIWEWIGAVDRAVADTDTAAADTEGVPA